ncbi:TIGR03987: family protein [uncultured Actinomyces sp.]|nr:TIGR03987: family protein [uncultured Actinomyces sp.]
MIAIASTAITLALVFYTIGVFAERRAGTLKLGHIIFFYIGLVFDTAGTAVISVITRGNSANLAHATTGLLAIILMIIHAAWATIAYAKKNPETLSRFHRLSIGVWLAGVARALRMRDAHGNSGAQARLECRLCKRDRHFCCRWATDLWSQGQAPAPIPP